ncbi:hypothetical protein ACFQRL_01925 [Microbacterium fluvii]|uniref:Phage T7 F exclusion suppressor FxsA n=1 Tax=Microbacterium fluvii TaxID=415215 RepID=A0ABW2HBA9_9MICO|nr:hypothetical protein [Microbacterium fluvii]MCU4671347.1 hypothetical protein [Microbacterium fluvii]
MKTWIVRFASLYVFDVAVLLVVGWLLPSVSVGWAALWAALLLTALTLWVKPVISRWFSSRAAKSAHERTKAGEKLVQFALVFIVELIVWVLVVLLSGVNVRGFFWGWVLPPIALLIAWIIYDAIDDKVEARAGALYDSATGGIRGSKTDAAATSPASPAAAEGRAELNDGLTAEQRRMLDDLG